MRLGPSRFSAVAPGNAGAWARVLLVEDDLLHKARAAAAEFLGPGDPDPTRRMHRPLPGDAFFECLAVGGDALVGRVIDANLRRKIGGEPLSEFGAKLGMLRTVGKIHGLESLLASEGVEAKRRRSLWQARPARHLRCGAIQTNLESSRK
jgi:hypothetical protein